MKAVNLLPSEHRGSVRTTGAPAKPEPAGTPALGAYLVLGLLAFAVVAAALTVLAGNTIKDRKAELARVTAEAQTVQAKAAALQAYAEFDGLAANRVSTVRGLAGARFNWERAFTDLSRALPGDVHLRSVEGATAGGATTASAVSAPSIKLTGCTTSQTAVARLMSRLRNIRGVTRVALARSQKVASATTAAAPTDGEGRPAALCPAGSPPDFDLTMFFERAALPATAAVNTTAAASATPVPGGSGGAPAAGAPTATPGAGTSTAPTTTTSTQGTTK